MQVKSEDAFFGSSTMHPDAHYDKSDFLDKKDCRLAHIFGITHISENCPIKCDACNSSFFRANCSIMDDGFCKDCLSPDMDCGHGYYRKKCGPKKDPGECKRCLDCPLGYWRDGCAGSLGSLGKCIPCHDFGDGKYNEGCLWVDPGGERVCEDCGEGMWLKGCGQTFPGVCSNCTVCGRHEYMVSKCEPRTDGSCSPCKTLLDSEPCDEGSYRKGCGDGSHGACTPCAAEPCPPGWYRVGCGSDSAGGCKKCAGCAVGEVREGCTGTDPGQCQSCGLCEQGEWREGCVYLDDGVCSACPDCGAER